MFDAVDSLKRHFSDQRSVGGWLCKSNRFDEPDHLHADLLGIEHQVLRFCGATNARLVRLKHLGSNRDRADADSARRANCCGRHSDLADRDERLVHDAGHARRIGDHWIQVLGRPWSVLLGMDHPSMDSRGHCDNLQHHHRVDRRHQLQAANLCGQLLCHFGCLGRQCGNSNAFCACDRRAADHLGHGCHWLHFDRQHIGCHRDG